MRFARYPIVLESIMHLLVSDLFIQRVFPIEEELFSTNLARKLKQMNGCVTKMRRV